MGKKVMIIEDEQIIAIHLEALLKQEGYNVVGTFETGEKAIEEVSALKPDAIFVDIMLAGNMNGIEAVKHIKEQFETCIIYLTSNSNSSVLEEAKQTFPSAFLKKPFDEQQLKATLDMTLSKFIEDKLFKEKLTKQNEMGQMQINELTETNAHLITATWRERELKNELQKTKELVETQNKKILDSINYSKRIQTAIIPESKDLERALGEHFVFYKPKDVVSGDFPWLYEREDYTYIAAVDCTGHGVPGAMMSLIGDLLLNDIVNNTMEQKTPGEILNELHTAVVKTLKQDAPGNKAADGMDVALCRISKDKSEIMYAGAHRPLYQLSNGEIIQYKGCKYPIGGMQYNGANTFENHTVNFKPGDSIYFFSDGLPDQFGGPENLKIGPKRIRNAILENEGKSMKEMKSVFYNLFTDWMGDEKQMDDVLMIGIQY